MTFAKIKSYIRDRRRFFILFAIIAACALLHLAFRMSQGLSDFFNFGPSFYIRALFSLINSPLPFSISETVILFMPLFTLGAPVVAVIYKDRASDVLFALLTMLAVLYSTFVLAFAPAYTSSSAYELFELKNDSATTAELEEATRMLTEEINELSRTLDFTYGSFSKMGYDLDALQAKLSESYSSLNETYPFIKNFKSRLKPIALSEALTYTHISGIYSYYTGEANINTNFPDYTLPYTSAHEMAHARGFARENEANFIAFLVCENSNDSYINYSGKLNMLEYMLNAIATDDPDFCMKTLSSLDIKVFCELVSYSTFFEPYRQSTASTVASAVNDTVLKSHGVKEGERSYGLVIDLAVAYLLDK